MIVTCVIIRFQQAVEVSSAAYGRNQIPDRKNVWRFAVD